MCCAPKRTYISQVVHVGPHRRITPVAHRFSPVQAIKENGGAPDRKQSRQMAGLSVSRYKHSGVGTHITVLSQVILPLARQCTKQDVREQAFHECNGILHSKQKSAVLREHSSNCVSCRSDDWVKPQSCKNCCAKVCQHEAGACTGSVNQPAAEAARHITNLSVECRPLAQRARWVAPCGMRRARPDP